MTVLLPKDWQKHCRNTGVVLEKLSERGSIQVYTTKIIAIPSLKLNNFEKQDLFRGIFMKALSEICFYRSHHRRYSLLLGAQTGFVSVAALLVRLELVSVDTDWS